MDFIETLGEIALGSRMKRLSERLLSSTGNIYKNQQVNFEPRWFTTYHLLYEKSPLSIVDIAKALGISHPAVNQIAKEMLNQGLIKATEDEQDKRKRLLEITEKGREMFPTLQPIWNGIRRATLELTYETGMDVLTMLERMEQALDEKTFHDRFLEHLKKEQLASNEIIDYDPNYREAFKRLNFEWIKKYFRVEPIDEKVCSDPEKEIIEKGGHIFFAKEESAIIGTCALIKLDDTTYELSKMAVTNQHQGKQIGKKLGQHCIQKAKELKAKTLIIETNSQLNRALALYRKLGFKAIPPNTRRPCEYERGDVQMELDLTTSS